MKKKGCEETKSDKDRTQLACNYLIVFYSPQSFDEPSFVNGCMELDWLNILHEPLM